MVLSCFQPLLRGSAICSTSALKSPNCTDPVFIQLRVARIFLGIEGWSATCTSMALKKSSSWACVLTFTPYLPAPSQTPSMSLANAVMTGSENGLTGGTADLQTAGYPAGL